jgi:hypothetical protein
VWRWFRRWSGERVPLIVGVRRVGRPNALSRDRHDSVMPHPSSRTFCGPSGVSHVHRRIRQTAILVQVADIPELSAPGVPWPCLSHHKLPVRQTSMRLSTSFAAPTRRLYASSVLQRRQFHATQCLKDAARPSEAEVDRARAYCANIVR